MTNAVFYTSSLMTIANMMSDGVENDRYVYHVKAVRMSKTIDNDPAVSKNIRSNYDIFMIYLVLGINLPNLL